jgi:four helix bundle protein
MNNIAEWYDRWSKANLTNFLNIALWSASEVKSMFYAAKDLEYISEQIFNDLMISISKIAWMLVNFKKSINIKP